MTRPAQRWKGGLCCAGIFANLAFEEIGLDLYVVVLPAGVAIYVLRRRGPQPLVTYHSVAYVLGLVLTRGENSHGLQLPVVWPALIA